jgi:hypothetical protein
LQYKDSKMADVLKIKVDVPEGKSGDWEIKKFTVTDKDVSLFNTRCMFSPGMGSRTMIAGDYTKLTRNGQTIMSDTRAEISDHFSFLFKAKGHVLINGLGLGWIVEALLRKKEVKTIVVIEKSKDVIDLVKQHYYDKCPKNKSLIIVHADAFEYKPQKGQRFDAVWHDIWDSICGDNIEDMKKLHRKYGRKTDWQGSWCRWHCEQANKRSVW